jgi:hypothetical protein
MRQVERSETVIKMSNINNFFSRVMERNVDTDNEFNNSKKFNQLELY